MMPSFSLPNLVAFVAQVALIVSAGGLFAWGFGLRAPRVVLAYWQALLLACVLLPVVQPWQETFRAADPALATTPAVLSETSVASFESATASATPSSRSIAFWVFLILGAGITARALWLAIGAARLQWLRRTASPIDPPAAFVWAQDRVGSGAEIRISDGVSGPITFGVRHPIVILPPAVLTMDVRVQEAIACHELLHVRRRDWLWEILEEGVRTVFWFHPAVWWLIGRIQLSREQVVDDITISVTNSREQYVNALLVVALAKSPITLVPAPLFLRKSLLKQRVAQILQETTMSTRRLVASTAASALALVIAATVAVRWFPLQAEGLVQSNNEPVQILRGGEHLLHGSLPEYPKRAIENKVEGDVALEVTLDDRGEVSDARVLAGPEELRRPALESVLQWHYSPAELKSTTLQTMLRFRLPSADAEFEGRKHAFAVKMKDPGAEDSLTTEAQKTEHLMVELEHALADPTASPEQRDEWKVKLADSHRLLEKIQVEREAQNGKVADGPSRLSQIRSERVTDQTVKEIVARAGIQLGDTLDKDTAKRIFEAAFATDEHIRVGFHSDGKGGMVLTLINP
jgi:bla regulator protein blaR1